MGPRYNLNEGKSATVSAAGIATITMTPPSTERWILNRAAVVTNQASTVTTIPIASLYLDSIADVNLIDSTYTGSRDSTDLDVVLEKGQAIIAQWTGGVAGSVASLSLFGFRELY